MKVPLRSTIMALEFLYDIRVVLWERWLKATTSSSIREMSSGTIYLTINYLYPPDVTWDITMFVPMWLVGSNLELGGALVQDSNPPPPPSGA